MKKICIGFFCLLLLTGCGRTAIHEPVVVAQDDGESASVTIAAPADVTAAETMDEAQVSCEAKYNADGVVCGFRMRFPRSAAVETMLSDQSNLYFGSAVNAKGSVSIPMESVRVLYDSETHTYDVTMLFSAGELRGDSCTVSFYIAPQDDAASALFCAQKVVEFGS